MDASEKTQSLWMEAKAKLQHLVDSDHYARVVARVFLMTEPEQFLQQELLTAGMVYVYPQYVNSCPKATGFRMAEAIAQQDKLGVWQGMRLDLGIIGGKSERDGGVISDCPGIWLDYCGAYRNHLTSFQVILGFEVSRYSAINDRGCLAKPFSARK